MTDSFIVLRNSTEEDKLKAESVINDIYIENMRVEDFVWQLNSLGYRDKDAKLFTKETLRVLVGEKNYYEICCKFPPHPDKAIKPVPRKEKTAPTPTDTRRHLMVKHTKDSPEKVKVFNRRGLKYYYACGITRESELTESQTTHPEFTDCQDCLVSLDRSKRTRIEYLEGLLKEAKKKLNERCFDVSLEVLGSYTVKVLAQTREDAIKEAMKSLDKNSRVVVNQGVLVDFIATGVVESAN